MVEATWLDRTIGWFSPATAVSRVRARGIFEEQTRGYAGAERGRQTDGWFTAATSADTEIGRAAPLLRERSRDLTRNNPYQAKAITGWVDSLVGDGIMPQIDTGSDARNTAVKNLFEEWSDNCDADGIDDFYGLQMLAAREVVEAGEGLVRRRWRRRADGWRVPVKLQVLEADLLDSSRTNQDSRGTNRIIQGIEFDAIGQRSAYWLFQDHPGNQLSGMMTSSAVPASEVLHLFERQRTQVRGVPWSTPVMLPIRHLSDYELAEVIRKKIEASVVTIVQGYEDGDASIAPKVTSDPAGKYPVEQFAPGMILYAKGTREIKFNSPATIGGYGEYKDNSLHTIAAGYRMPFEALSGNLSQVNYSSIRAGLVEWRRLTKSLATAIFVRRLCVPAWNWFVEGAIFAGELKPEEMIAVKWALPKFDWVDPASDVEADINAIRSGLKTLPEVLAERGRTLEEVVAEIKQTNALLDAANIKLDTDPRHMTKVGKDQGSGGGDSSSPSRFVPAEAAD